MLGFLFEKYRRAKATSFFDMRSAEKKKIINKAVAESTKKQVKLLRENGYIFR